MALQTNGQEMQGLVVRCHSEKEESILEKALAIGASGRSANENFEFVNNSGLNIKMMVSCEAYVHCKQL